jgi:hypothetical protein
MFPNPVYAEQWIPVPGACHQESVAANSQICPYGKGNAAAGMYEKFGCSLLVQLMYLFFKGAV